MQKPLAELKRQCEEARALAALGDFKIWIECTSWAELHDADDLLLGQAYQRPLRLAHWRTLANLVGCNSLPRLRELRIIGCSNGDEGVQLLAAGVRQGCLPPLRALSLFNNQVGEEGASALASAVTESAMPSLDSLNVGNNRIGDAGLIALASALRRLPTLKHLWLTQNQISDVGLVNLLCHAATNGLKSCSRALGSVRIISRMRVAPPSLRQFSARLCRRSATYTWRASPQRASMQARHAVQSELQAFIVRVRSEFGASSGFRALVIT